MHQKQFDIDTGCVDCVAVWSLVRFTHRHPWVKKDRLCDCLYLRLSTNITPYKYLIHHADCFLIKKQGNVHVGHLLFLSAHHQEQISVQWPCATPIMGQWPGSQLSHCVKTTLKASVVCCVYVGCRGGWTEITADDSDDVCVHMSVGEGCVLYVWSFACLLFPNPQQHITLYLTTLPYLKNSDLGLP